MTCSPPALAKGFQVTAKADQVSFYKVYKAVKSKSPTFHLRAFELAQIPAATGLRGPMATRWKRTLLGDYKTCVALAFDDFDAAIDEINGLMVAQQAICAVTQAPVILGWNRQTISPTRA